MGEQLLDQLPELPVAGDVREHELPFEEGECVVTRSQEALTRKQRAETGRLLEEQRWRELVLGAECTRVLPTRSRAQDSSRRVRKRGNRSKSRSSVRSSLTPASRQRATICASNTRLPIAFASRTASSSSDG